MPHVRPQLLDVFFTKNKLFDRRFTEFGGVRQGSDGDFVPTGETLAFLVACNDLENRFTLQSLFDGDHVFARHNILRLNASARRAADESAAATLGRVPELLHDRPPRRPDFGASFPARFIETRLTWDDLVLHPGTRRQIDEIETWLEHGETLMNDWGMAPKLRPGYRSLFYGPPGTGKTMTACLLGKSTGRDVYKVDLSLVVSKYIGETEKNLARVFDQAQHKGWILFFDEADALFGKRSETRTPTTATPTRRSPSCSSGSRPSTASPFSPPTCARTSTTPSPGASSRSSTSPCRAPRSGCSSGAGASRRRPGSTSPSTWRRSPPSTRSREARS